MTATNNPIRGLAEHREGENRGYDFSRLAELLSVDQQVAKSLGSAHELRGNHEHPAEAKARAQRDDIAR